MRVCMDLLIAPITITPHKNNFVINVTCVGRTIQQQGEELGISERLLQLLSFRLRDVVYELFASILVDIGCTDMNSMASFQLTKLGTLRVWEILSCEKVCDVKLHSWLVSFVIRQLNC